MGIANAYPLRTGFLQGRSRRRRAELHYLLRAAAGLHDHPDEQRQRRAGLPPAARRHPRRHRDAVGVGRLHAGVHRRLAQERQLTSSRRDRLRGSGMDRLKRLAPFLKPLLILALFAVALRVLHDTLAQYRYRDVIRYLDALPIDQILLEAAPTLLGYLVMTGYDTLAFRYIRHPLPYFKIALASFIGYAFNNNAGFSGLVGGSLRYRLYNAWRLTAVEIAKVIAFCTISFWLGFVLLGGVFFLTTPPDIPPSIPIPFASIRLLGIVLLLPAIAYILWIAIRRQPVRIRQWEFELPSAGLFILQAAVSSIDWMLAAAVLYILLPDSLPLTFGRFVGI